MLRLFLSYRFRTHGRLIARGLIFLLPILGLLGCGHPPAMVYKYILEYTPPPAQGLPPLEDSLKVQHFAVAQEFNTTAMVYRPTPYKSETYTYHRWRVNPGYLVTDYLLRDFRAAGLFKAVLPADSSSKSRFLLEGGVEEIQELDSPAGWQAGLTLTVTLLDLQESEITKRVVYQKTFKTREAMTDKTPQGLAEALSRAMQRLSGEICLAVYQAARKVSTKEGLKPSAR